MSARHIKRIAFLQEYTNRPETLLDVLPEVAHKGYCGVAVAGRIGQERALAALAAEAARNRLETAVFTGFMKYEYTHLRDNPEQRLVLNGASEAVDQDRVSVNWGCPFNPSFRERYFGFLERLGKTDGVTEVWVNDEAYLGFGPDRLACYCPTCREAWQAEMGGDIPAPPFADAHDRARFLSWRFRRWNGVHAAMRDVLNRHHPVRAVFLTSPACCWDMNPWISAVEFSGMLGGIDGLITDPYYTFHLPQLGGGQFQPVETYLSETCRYIRGATGEGKLAGICAQGFSHPTFLRPLDAADGWWAGVVPLALGIDHVTTYTYLLQRVSPMFASYEESFRLDPVFERVRPIEFMGVVESLETQCHDLDSSGAGSWRHTRMMPLAALGRHNGLPHTFVPSPGLSAPALRRFPVVALPGVSCLSLNAREALADYVRGGGVLVAAGETATRNEIGEPENNGFLRDIFGVASRCVPDAACELAVEGRPAFDDLPWPDEVTAGYMDGANRPALALNHVVETDVAPGVDVVAAFAEDLPALGGAAAITVRSVGAGHAVFVAGIPERFHVRRDTQVRVLNYAPRLLARLITDLAGARLPVRAIGFPPKVPMQGVRPLDWRWMPTMEFLPSVGEDCHLVTVASYFKEPFAFEVESDVPAGRQCLGVEELVAKRQIEFRETLPNCVRFDVSFSTSDALKVYRVSFTV